MTPTTEIVTTNEMPNLTTNSIETTQNVSENMHIQLVSETIPTKSAQVTTLGHQHTSTHPTSDTDTEGSTMDPVTSDSSSLLSYSSDMSKTSTGNQFTELLVTCATLLSDSRRPPVVDSSLLQLEWEESNFPTILNNYNFRCLTPWGAMEYRPKVHGPPKNKLSTSIAWSS